MSLNISESQQSIKVFFDTREEKFVEFKLDCPIEERIEYICKVMKPWLTSARLNFNFTIAKIAEIIPLSSIKIFIYRLLGVNIGTGVFISPDVILDPHFPKLITIEDYCVLGWGSKIFTHEMSTKKYRVGRVTIKKGAVVGGFSVIRSGVTIGEMSQVCMNSYIYRDVQPNQSVKYEGLNFETKQQYTL